MKTLTSLNVSGSRVCPIAMNLTARILELLYEQAYWEYIINHPCHAPLEKYAEEDAFAVLIWFAEGVPMGSLQFRLIPILTKLHPDRLLHPEDSITPYSSDLSRQLIDLLTTLSERKVFEGTRSGYIKTHLVATILERVGWSLLVNLFQKVLI